MYHLSPHFLNIVYIASLKSHGSTALLYSSFAAPCQRSQVTRNVNALWKERARGERQTHLSLLQRRHAALGQTLKYAADLACVETKYNGNIQRFSFLELIICERINWEQIWKSHSKYWKTVHGKSTAHVTLGCWLPNYVTFHARSRDQILF